MLIRATYAGVAAIYHQVNRVDIYVFILPTIDVIIFYGFAMAFLRQLGRSAAIQCRRFVEHYRPPSYCLPG